MVGPSLLTACSGGDRLHYSDATTLIPLMAEAMPVYASSQGDLLVLFAGVMLRASVRMSPASARALPTAPHQTFQSAIGLVGTHLTASA
ncbi:MAG: hypothetical protein AAGB11_08900 [Pseudomonadota bacterium]